MTKFLAIYDDEKGKRKSYIYNSWEAYHKDTFNPYCEQIFLMDIAHLKGNTYKERKAELRQRAVEWSNNMGEATDLSYGELFEIQSFFEKFGKKYGLLREFRENCIC